MNLFDLPEEVIEGCLLPWLGWNDLLRFRRVSKATLGITTGYMRTHPELAPELEVNEEEKNLKAFLEMDIPSTKLFLNNKFRKFYSGKEDGRQEDLQCFLERYGGLVKFLRVNQLSIYLFGKEWDFLEGFTNLQSLEAPYFGVGPNEEEMDSEEYSESEQKLLARAKKDPRFMSGTLPTNWSGLKRLKIGQLENQVVVGIVNRTFVYLHGCPQLEYVSLPFSPYVNEFPFDPLEVLGFTFALILKLVEQQEQETLKTFDFASYHYNNEIDPSARSRMESRASHSFLQLCVECLKRNVKLENVGAYWFQGRHTFPELSDPELGSVVRSMINIKPCVFTLEMPCLERIDIKASDSNVTISGGAPVQDERPEWPALKILKIKVDCKQVFSFQARTEFGDGDGDDDDNDEEEEEDSSDDDYYDSDSSSDDDEEIRTMHLLEVKDLFNFLFSNVRRLALSELCLEFTKASDVAIPNTKNIVDACPNLKKITLNNWRGTNKALVNLWKGLEGLEEVSLEYCKELGNVAFVGEDKSQPAFFKLKKLKKLTLKGLDQMPKITDTLFKLVIRHLKLKQLVITSEEAVKTITRAGVESLLEGEFANSIEKFPFGNWSIADMQMDEWKLLERKFRSFDML